jgi:hypothetical protein
MSAFTDGTGDDSVLNTCGIVKSHAFSILAAFTMIDKNNKEHKCILLRNPWGITYYNKEWSKDDPNWTDDLIAQVPWQVDVRTE